MTARLWFAASFVTITALASNAGAQASPPSAAELPPPSTEPSYSYTYRQRKTVDDYDEAVERQWKVVAETSGPDKREELLLLSRLRRERDEHTGERSTALVVGGVLVMGLGLAACTLGGLALGDKGGSSFDSTGFAMSFMVPGAVAAVGGIAMVVYGSMRVVKEPPTPSSGQLRLSPFGLGGTF